MSHCSFQVRPIRSSYCVLDCSLKECSDVLLSYDTGNDIRETLSVAPSRSIILQVRISSMAFISLLYTAKNASDLLQVSILQDCYNLSTSGNKLVNFFKL